MVIVHSSNKDIPIKDKIAYFTMEVGIKSEMATYSGGLGILAGDTLKSFADVGVPAVGMSLLNEKGYFYQKLDDDGNQIEEDHRWKPHEHMELLPNEVSIVIENRFIKIRAWRYTIIGVKGYEVPVYFLDTNIDGNSDYDRTLTQQLYAGDRYYRLCQEMVLGIGGVRMLKELGYDNLNKYHMNEGHAALLSLELYHQKKAYDIEHDELKMDTFRKLCVFTTHTPVPAGHDKFDIDVFRRVMNGYMPEFIMQKGLDYDHFNMTLLAMNMSKYVNGVAKRHGEVTRDMFPGYAIDSVTNGVHSNTWISEPMRQTFDDFIPGWAADPYTLRYALQIPKERIGLAHAESKQELMDYINSKTDLKFEKDAFTIGFARRFTGYKRPDLILFDTERLKKIAKDKGKIQIVFAGKAHRHDGGGKETIRKVIHTAADISDENLKIIYLENYNMTLGKMMTSGVDVWLNNPIVPLEASGTSGMKACLNGIPHFSTLDGWWLEGHVENVTGWSIGLDYYKEDLSDDDRFAADANSLYDKLDNAILSKYYHNKDGWIEMMKYCIAYNASFFNTYRMVLQYVTNAYLN